MLILFYNLIKNLTLKKDLHMYQTQNNLSKDYLSKDIKNKHINSNVFLKLIKKILLLLIACLFINTSLYSIVGSTKGKGSVNNGDFNYILDIKTPKGIDGLKPKLSINYNSASNTNSILGVGFSLSGLSQISKCNQNTFKEKQDTSINYNYCLDGQKLLLVNQYEKYANPNTEYKTALNSHRKIVKYNSYWIVYSKDGLIYEYGRHTNSNIANITYKLNKITNRYGNSIIFNYHPNNHQVSNGIKSIEYSNNRIDFIYENRSDKKTVYFKGTKSNINQKLKYIDQMILIQVGQFDDIQKKNALLPV